MRDEFIITRQGRQYALYSGLLDEAHARGLRSIDTDLLQVPDPENGNVAIVKAVAELPKVDRETGEIIIDPETQKPLMGRFSGIGDASPENVGRNIAPHIIRMAETRAKARALRDAVNVGAIPFEELSEADGAEASPRQSSGGQSGRGTSSQPTPISSAQRSSGQRSGSSSDAQQAAGGEKTQKRGPKARKSQVDLLKTLAVEWAGEGGVERLEKRIEKPLKDLSREEADLWIERLTPEENAEGANG